MILLREGRQPIAPYTYCHEFTFSPPHFASEPRGLSQEGGKSPRACFLPWCSCAPAPPGCHGCCAELIIEAMPIQPKFSIPHQHIIRNTFCPAMWRPLRPCLVVPCRSVSAVGCSKGQKREGGSKWIPTSVGTLILGLSCPGMFPAHGEVGARRTNFLHSLCQTAPHRGTELVHQLQVATSSRK